MRILFDQVVYSMRNKGNIALLQIALRRIRRLWPEASLEVMTESPHILRLYCPEAFSQIAPDHPDLHLVIVSAEQRRRLLFQRMVSERSLDDRVHLLAALAPSDLAVLYNLAEVFVYPSERESFGLPPLEAMASGAPTIAMNMTSLPEIMGDGALLIGGKDPQTWANAIEQVLTDDVLRRDLVSRGLKQAAKLTWQQCAEETIQVYCAVAQER